MVIGQTDPTGNGFSAPEGRRGGTLHASHASAPEKIPDENALLLEGHDWYVDPKRPDALVTMDERATFRSMTND